MDFYLFFCAFVFFFPLFFLRLSRGQQRTGAAAGDIGQIGLARDLRRKSTGKGEEMGQRDHDDSEMNVEFFSVL